MSIPFKAYQGSDPFIFVSYAHKDKKIVYPEIKRFHEFGYRIWYDEGIPPTVKWAQKIAKSIVDCELFLVFITPNSVASENVKDEIHLAYDEKKTILAIYLKESQLPIELKLRLSRIQAIMKHQLSDEDYWQKVLSAIPEILKKPSEISLTLEQQKLENEKTKEEWIEKKADIESQNVLKAKKSIKIFQIEADVLEQIEQDIKMAFPNMSNIDQQTFGFTVQKKHVTGLKLYRKKLRRLPDSIIDLVCLHNLHLHYNSLYSLPQSFHKLIELKTLDLSYNNFKSLPETFGGLMNLEILLLNNNALILLPKNFGFLPNLKKLELFSNNLDSLPSSFGHLSKLEGLNLEGNLLTSLPESFGRLKNLQTLNLSGNQLTSLPESFGRLKNLQTLNLSGNQLKFLPISISNLENLKNLYIWNNPLDSIPEFLKELKKRECFIL